MNPDLRAIEAALLGEPHDPSNLSPEAASVVLPLVRRLAQERDDGRHEIDVLRRERHAERQRVDERDQEVTRLRAALEEARLTLAAEQGRAEGAPSPRWRYGYTSQGQAWVLPYLDADIPPEYRGREWTGAATDHDPICRVYRLFNGKWALMWRLGAQEPTVHDTARAAMLTADKAIFESRRIRCLAKARQLQTDGVILYPPNGTHQQTAAIMIDRLSDPGIAEAVLAIYEDLLFNQKEVKP